MTVVHESSFIKGFDEFFVKTLSPEYEKLTGIKVGYETVSVGSMLTRLTTIVETKAGPGAGRHRPQLAASLRPGSAGRHRRGGRDRQEDRPLARQHLRRGGGEQEVEGDPVGQHRPARGVPDRLVQGGRRHQVPGHLGGSPDRRAHAQEEGAPVRLRDRARLRRQPRLDVPAALVLRRPRGRQGRQDGARSTRPRRPRRSTSAGSSTRRR